MEELLTKNGHNMYDIASMLQKAIRRSDLENAGYAANELFGFYHSYLWNRLMIISAEDCNDCITKEIIALWQADLKVNKNRKGYDKYSTFVSKAIVLLVKARKNRDADYFSCNLMYSEDVKDISEYRLDGGIPKYTFDVHTLKGKKMGKTIKDMIKTEQEALKPVQMGLFDTESWDNFNSNVYKKTINQPKVNQRPSQSTIRKQNKDTKDLAETMMDIVYG